MLYMYICGIWLKMLCKKKVNLNNFISAIFEKLDFFFSGIIIILNEC